MMTMLEQLGMWHWLVAGVVLLILELLAPGAFFLWLGIAAIVVGGLVLLVPGIGWEWQVVVFAAGSVVSVLAWRAYRKARPLQTDKPRLNRRGEQYIGRRLTLDEPIDNGRGKVRVDDSTWKVSGPDLAAGTDIIVVGVDGVVFDVEPAKSKE